MTKKNYTNWFPHDTNPRSNRNLKALFSMYRAEGYGLWWLLQEILCLQPGYKLDISDAYAYTELADDLRCDAALLERFITDCVNKFHLLVCDNTHLWCPELIEAMVPLEEKRVVLRERGKKGGKASAEKRTTSQAQVEETPTRGQAQVEKNEAQNKTGEKKTKENRTTENRTTVDDAVVDVVISSEVNTNNKLPALDKEGCQKDGVVEQQHTNATNNSSLQASTRKTEELHNHYTANPAAMGTETMMQRALGDNEFCYITMQSFRISSEQLRQWLGAFNRKLAYEADTIKNDKEYRRHFANWLKYRDVQHEDPAAYQPVSTELPPGKTKRVVPLEPGMKTGQQIIAEQRAYMREMEEKWKDAG